MGLFNPRASKKRKLIRTINIQASVEGAREDIIIESMLSGARLNVSVPGTMNAFLTYDSQVAETYRKYNGFSSFGSQQARTVIDLRTAFIAGEGISVSCEKEKTAKWIENFIELNQLSGPGFMNAVKGAEMAGQSLFILKEAINPLDMLTYIKASRIPYHIGQPYKPIYIDPILNDEIKDILIKKNGFWESLGLENFIYVRTGGDDANSEGPSTRVGIVLTDLENYDRAIKDMRRNNHIFARITPVFETTNETESKNLRAKLNELRWKIGEAFIGTAKFKYETPQSGAHQNLSMELASTIKTISAVTGVPVHWLGYVDLMSNRSTAESLYELIKNATILERQIWERALYCMIQKAQIMYIDFGGTDLNLDNDFEIKLPLIDFNEFLNRVRGLNMAYGDKAISMDDYRGMLPGIDPLKTRRAIEKEEKENESREMNAMPKLEGDEENGNY